MAGRDAAPTDPHGLIRHAAGRWREVERLRVIESHLDDQLAEVRRRIREATGEVADAQEAAAMANRAERGR